MLLQNIGLTFRATFVAATRQGLAFIPSVFLLPLICKLVGAAPLLGLQLAQAFSDILAFVISVPIGLGVLRELRAGKLYDIKEEKKS